MSSLALSRPPSAMATPILPVPQRHSSPWSTLAHNLSTTSLPRRLSASQPRTPEDSSIPQLSTSQALRQWETLLAQPSTTIHRQALLHPLPSPSPKLAAERDKEGHIEYKLKLIEPSQERFEKLTSQMMWRLKEGRNEAIYEIGLADDGTVIGLTRQEMDASLCTLENMAAELGATIIILQEIVLLGSVANPPRESGESSLSSSTTSVDRDGWIIQRPDLDPIGAPRKGTRVIGGTPVVEVKKKWRRRKKAHDSPLPSPCAQKPYSDEETTFALDMDCSAPRLPVSTSEKQWAEKEPRKQRSIPQLTLEEKGEQERKKEVKHLKSLMRMEKRRLDLLRGDGMTPSAYSQPVSLSIPPDPPDEDEIEIEILHQPLDNLSFSFAQVSTVDNPEPPSPSSSSSTCTEYSLPLENKRDIGSGRFRPPPPGEEMICVEVLVVRKSSGEWEDEWGYGGEEDGWGFGGEDD
ncbi:hypothetical protein P7C73_g3331, partial [Tremellales sp. Uapishka_1]